MKEEGTRKDRDFEEVVKASQPKFLEVVKETYYLAVLGSLCIAVSAFTQQNFPQVQVYAITGASMFLLAFVCSFISKIISNGSVIILSYISTGTGVLMLFLVTMGFVVAFPLVFNAFIALYYGLILTVFVVVPYNLFHYRRKSKGITKIIVTISMVFLSISLPFQEIILISAIFFVVTTFESLFIVAILIAIMSFFIGLAALLVALPLIYKERKLRRKEEKIQRIYIDEGSGL